MSSRTTGAVRARVGVVVPTRDRWARARCAVRAALDQRDVAIEVVLVDDGSVQPPERTGVLADPRVAVLRNERSLGVSAARNRGLMASSAPWRAVLDDDDVWGPDKLRRQLDAAARSAAPWAFSGAWHVDSRFRPLRFEPAPPGPSLARGLVRCNLIPAGASNVLIDADLLKEVRGFDGSFGQLADWDLWLRLARAAQPATVAEGDVAYVHHPTNMGATGSRTVYAEYGRLRRRHGQLARSLGQEFEGRDLVEWYVARLALGGHPFRAALAGVEGGVRLRQPRLLWSYLRRALRPPTAPNARASGETGPTPPPWLEALARAASERRGDAG